MKAAIEFSALPSATRSRKGLMAERHRKMRSAVRCTEIVMTIIIFSD